MSGNRRELASLLAACTTAPRAVEAGVVADWLEEFGDAGDAQALRTLQWVRDEDWIWNARPRTVGLRDRDANWVLGTPTVHFRERVIGTPYHVHVYSVRALAYRIMSTPNHHILWFLLPWGEELPAAEIQRPGMVEAIMEANGVARLPDETEEEESNAGQTDHALSQHNGVFR